MVIKLPHVEAFDTLDLPDDFEERVKKSFGEYTYGTSDDYTFEDKLQYIDNLRGRFLHKGSVDEHVKALILDHTEYEIDMNGDFPDKEDFWSFGFMCECFEKGNFQFRDTYEEHSHRKNEETLKVILEIIKIVVNWEKE